MATTIDEDEDKSERAVRIITQNGFAVMDPPVIEVTPILEYAAKAFEPGGPCGYQEVEKPHRAWDLDFRGRLAFSVGLLDRVLVKLREMGYRYEIEDRRKIPPLEVNHDVFDKLAKKQRGLLRAIHENPLGRIECESDDRFEKLCVLLDVAFPNAEFVVATATIGHAIELWNRLHGVAIVRPGLAVPGRRFMGDRWQIGVFSKFSPRAMSKDAILLLPDAGAATGNKFHDWFIRTLFIRRYAFVRPGRRFDRLMQIRLEQVAGSVIHRSAYRRVPVKVLILPIPRSFPETETTAALEQKRMWYWHHAARNERIASVAQNIVSFDRVALTEQGLGAVLTSLGNGNKPRVAILVESSEHGRELLARLPGWTLRTHRDEETTQVVTADRVIVTEMAAAMAGIRANIIVNATGTEWPPRVKNFPPRRERGSPNSVVVIDFADEFCRQASRAYGRRLNEYRRRGYRIETITHNQTHDENTRTGATRSVRE